MAPKHKLKETTVDLERGSWDQEMTGRKQQWPRHGVASKQGTLHENCAGPEYYQGVDERKGMPRSGDTDRKQVIEKV